MASPDSSKISKWATTKTKTKDFFDKAGSSNPIIHIRGTFPAENYWPAPLDKEAKKAARMLRSFFIDGYVVPYRTLNRVPNDTKPTRGSQQCKRLAIFTVLRNGLHWSGAAGSGIILARRSNGPWSAQGAILIHAGGWSFPEGGDVYDCVCAINDDKAMEACSRSRCTFGDDVSASGPGPLGGSVQDSETKAAWAPVWMYLKSKGHSIEGQVKVTTLVQRISENEHFYGVDNLFNSQILAGEVQAPTGPATQLLEALDAIAINKHDSIKLPSSG